MYHSDKPIEQFDQDLLGRATFARQLADSILSIDIADSFAVGIYGKWGTGKTSVLNMMQKEIEAKALNDDGSQRAIVMRFEPWNFSTCDQLLTQFFAQMATVVSSEGKSESLKKVGKALEQYSSGFEILELLPVAGQYIKKLSEIVGTVGKAIKEDAEEKLNSLAARKQMVEDALRDQDCRIVVIIDDIDRLSNEQIKLVFQLVSSVAGFPKVVYVLSFDRDIVARALQTVQMDNGLEYLEKVIQVPFELPEVEKAKVTGVFVNRLDELLKQYSEIEVNSEYWTTVYSTCIAPFIHTLRDVNRVINAISLKLALVKNEVNFVDLTAITVFQSLRPWIFDWIKENKNTLLGLFSFEEAFDLDDSRRRKPREHYIHSLTATGEENAERVFNALTILFPQFGSATNTYHIFVSDDELRREKRIAHSDKFDLYTTLSLEKIPLSTTEIQSAIFNFDETEFSNLLLQLNCEHKASDFLLELKSRISEIPQEQIPILISSLLESICNFESEQRDSVFSFRTETLAEINIKALLEAMKDDKLRSVFLLELLTNCSANSLCGFSSILNSIELSHGRLAANGEKRGNNSIISLEELEQIEEVYMARVYKLFGETELNILKLPHARMVCYLWSSFDKASYSKKMNTLMTDNENICRYVAMYASKPTIIVGPNKVIWEFSNDYLEFVSDETISTALNAMLKDSTFKMLDQELQCTMAAYDLWRLSGKKDDDQITEDAVKRQLKKWEESINILPKEGVCDVGNGETV